MNVSVIEKETSLEERCTGFVKVPSIVKDSTSQVLEQIKKDISVFSFSQTAGHK